MNRWFYWFHSDVKMFGFYSSDPARSVSHILSLPPPLFPVFSFTLWSLCLRNKPTPPDIKKTPVLSVSRPQRQPPALKCCQQTLGVFCFSHRRKTGPVWCLDLQEKPTAPCSSLPLLSWDVSWISCLFLAPYSIVGYFKISLSAYFRQLSSPLLLLFSSNVMSQAME